jgi:hypothetical protein
MEQQKIIRVFARKTSMTPNDELAFYDCPPLYDQPDRNIAVLVSVTFIWDIEKGRMLQRTWHEAGYYTALNGPALNNPGSDFVPGRFLKKGITITSRGCPKRCSWCFVPKREGKLREINIAPGHIVQDNNLLACSRGHIEKVFEMLDQQKKGAQFKGGLDIDYFKPWHVDLFKSIKIAKSGLWVACDREQDLPRLDKARDLLSDFNIEKKRCYVLVGMDGESQEQAQRRLIAVLQKGFLHYAQLYRATDSPRSRGDWRNFCYFWAKPHLYRKIYG